MSLIEAIAAPAPQQRISSAERSIGARIRLRRHYLGITQSALGAAIGVSFQQIQKYENGANATSPTRLLQIAGVLQCSLGYLIAGCDADPAIDVDRATMKAAGTLMLLAPEPRAAVTSFIFALAAQRA